ncbi:MAG: hypothetical protein LUI87_04265 [Lachnospiraceae bacterium]|nr:hypothetical protein [Lachnospiraceae bacterium]
MSMLVLLILFLMFWLFVKFTGIMLKICYVLCVGIPLALMFIMIGVILCCTLLLAPLGTSLMRLAGRIVYPF